MPRYVILRHEMPGSQRGLHWDFMLENGPLLRTWALDQEPCAGMTIRAEVLADHRAAYLEYEGPISGDRGTVLRWDSGEYEMLEERSERLVVRLRGNRLVGIAMLLPEAFGSHRWTINFAT
jgi:hypothetical protein